MLIKINKKGCLNPFIRGVWVILTLCILGNNAISQDIRSSIKNHKIYLRKSQLKLKEIFEELEKYPLVHLSINDNELDLNQKITMPKLELSVDKILKELVKQTGIEYQYAGKQIIIRKKKTTNKLRSKYTVSGYVKDQTNGEELIGVNVYLQGTYSGTTTNAYGFYSLGLLEGQNTIVYSYVGFDEKKIDANLDKNTLLSVEISPGSTELEEVVITGENKNKNITSHRMGYEKIQSSTIKRMPVLLGEPDVIKTLKFMPGVQPTSETSSGLSVRGGNYDQNLILLDEATVYNVSHFLGFFSVFNTDAIKNVEFYKGNIPAEYGGRLSSVIDIRMREGDMKKLSVDGGIGLIASKLTISAPIVKDKGSFLISGRRTYLDLLTSLSSNPETKSTKVYFYDFNIKSNYKLNDKNRIFLSGYFGRDKFGYKEQKTKDILAWGNYTGTARWNHIYGSKLFSNVSLIVSNYNYKTETNYEDDLFHWDADLADYSAKIDFSYFPNSNNSVKFGLRSTYHSFSPGNVETKIDTVAGKFNLPKTRSLEYSAYISNIQTITPKFSVQYGLNYSIFQNMGKSTIYKYNNQYEHIDTIQYDMGELYNTQGGLEPRISLNYLFNDRNSVKASYSRTRQYIQRVSNTTSGTPLDIWIPSSPNIKPQAADLYSLGYFHNTNLKDIKVSMEVFYSDMSNQIDFKDHAEIYLTEEIEKEMRFGIARAYGLELNLKKPQGKFNGWISYTLSKAERKIIGLNNNKWFLSPYDRTHNLAIVTNYELTNRISISLNWVFTSGQAFTSPTGKYYYQGKVLLQYSEKNEDRLPAYHRLDVGIQLKSKPKLNRRFSSTLNLSVYNAYNNKNPMTSIAFVEDEKVPNKILAQKYYLPIIPTISWNFNF